MFWHPLFMFLFCKFLSNDNMVPFSLCVLFLAWWWTEKTGEMFWTCSLGKVVFQHIAACWRAFLVTTCNWKMSLLLLLLLTLVKLSLPLPCAASKGIAYVILEHSGECAEAPEYFKASQCLVYQCLGQRVSCYCSVTWKFVLSLARLR